MKQLITIQAFIFLCSNLLFAQPLQFSTITVKNGLNVNSVNDIIKDKKGFIWAATSDGICRYDGRNFKQYHFDKNKPNSLHSYIYTAIWEDIYGNIWLGGENGVEVIEAKTGNIKFILKDDLLIVISDNGKGFNVNSEVSGYGLDNMKWRAKEAGVQIQIKTAKNEGTTFIINTSVNT